jgi:glycosidase
MILHLRRLLLGRLTAAAALIHAVTRLRASRHAAIAAWLACASAVSPVRAVDVSAPAILQIFEARWETIEDRMADIHAVGYGRLWLPPPARADSGGLSVGYDVFDRFDLGKPRSETLYGTETGLKTLVRSAHSAGVLVNTDFIPNHNGFSDSSTVDTRGTATTADDVTFVQAGGYPGFVVTLPGDIDGDFHGAFEGGEQNFRLSGLIDIAQEKNHQFIRHPTTPGNPQNIPAGMQGIFGRPPANVPDPNNARYYPDQGLGGATVFDPRLGQNVTLYDFNTANPLAGDPVAENALGLVMRNARWMIQEVGVDGFRIDAGRHFPRWVLDYLDQATFLAKQEPLLDGSPQHPFSFIETGEAGDVSFMQGFVRKDINNANLGQVGGNRDGLDFKLFNALKQHLTNNGTVNNWHGIRNTTTDTYDDGLRNGSQGVAFAQSHDELGPYLQNVAYAYILMRPGNAIVYTNAKEFGNGRDFPRGGKDDALGGFHGETVTTLVDIRNTHGRGNFHERWLDDAFNPFGFSNIYIYERGNSAVVGLNSRLDAGYDERSPVQTTFAPGTVLVELTGNAADATVDPSGDIPEAIRVNGGGQVNIRVPRNAGHGRGYVIYGVAPPQGSLSLTNVAATMQGATPTAANNGTARLADIDVIMADSFAVQLNTTPVTLPAPAGEASPVRDVHADGDTALLKIDGGVNLNSVPGIDHVTPGSVDYGFEEFTGVRSPGYVFSGGVNVGTGVGAYSQTIDATQLAEGRHYITARAFRHRDAATGGDGGPAVFTDFTKTIYVDRLKPESAIVSFEPFASSPSTLSNRDLIVRSTDGTADNMHFFLDLAPNLTDSQILQMVGGGNSAGYYDRDSFIRGYTGVRTGNHVATVVTFEPTGNWNVQRFSGLLTQTGLGGGFGDLTGNALFTTNDLLGANNGSFEQVLYSQGNLFNAAADLDGDGEVTNLDLFDLGPALTANGVSPAVQNAYDQLLLKRADVNQDGVTNTGDIAALYASFGGSAWLADMNVDGAVDVEDVRALVTDLLRTSPADFNLDRVVDGADFLAWQMNIGTASARFDQGDADFDGVVDGEDLNLWNAAFGTLGPITSAGPATTAVPEPVATVLACSAAALLAKSAKNHRRRV